MGIELFLAWRYLFKGRSRQLSFISVVSCLGMMLGVATLIIVISVMNGFDSELTDKLLQFNHHITLEKFSGTDVPEICREVAGIEGVENCSPYVTTQIFAKFGEFLYPVFVKGIDLEDKIEFDKVSRFIVSDNGGSGLWVGNGIATRYYFDAAIDYYPLDKSAKIKRAVVRGIFKSDICRVIRKAITEQFL